MPSLTELLGKKIVAYRGIPRAVPYSAVKIPMVDFILFDDGETYVELRRQDRYEYHDCSPSAREINVYKDKKIWKTLIDCEHGYLEASHLDI